MMNLLRRLADNTSRGSLASRLRRKRFRLFKGLISAVDKKPLKILDAGGTPDFWKRMDFLTQSGEAELTVLNLFKTQSHYLHITSVVGDARDMKEFRDGQFDVVFSNSVIEHVGDFAHQKRMAQEIRRIGNGYFVQTPNRHFPIEPHFLFPFFQFLPLGLRAFLVRHFRIGWHGPTRDMEKAWKTVASVRLLTKSEVARLFPDGQIYEERFLGLVKSFIVFRPCGAAREREEYRHSVPENAAVRVNLNSRESAGYSPKPGADAGRRPGSCV